MLNYSLSLHDVVYLWSASEVKRYIPGNIWSFVGRSIAFSQLGVKKKDIASLLLFEQEYVLAGSFMVSLLSVPFLIAYMFPVFKHIPVLWLWESILLVFGVGLFIYLPLLTNRLPSRINKIVTYLLPHFSKQNSLLFLGLAALAFTLFGLGYYFAISSLAALPLQQLFVLSGFFVFSLVVGLLSFFTPTGLGVREGMITLGLAKLLPISIAGFVSLFGRIILIISELLFLVLSYGYKKLMGRQTKKLEKFIGSHVQEVLAGCMLVLFVGYFSLASFLRYDNFYTGRFDLGNMDQTVWNTVHGHIFQLTDPNGTETVSRLAFHSDFLLAGLAPLYILWEDPRMLLLIQVLIVAIGGIFLYLLAAEILKNKTIGLVITAAYLLNPSLERATIYDFHAVTLATTFLLASYYFMRRKNYIAFIISAILAGITKEEIWIITGFMGGLVAFQGIFQTAKNNQKIKQVIVGLSLAIASLGIFYFLVWYAIPGSSNSQEHFALSYFNENNDSPSSVVKNIFLAPDKTIQKILQNERIDYYQKLFQPVGYLTLFAPQFLILPSADLVLNILSDKGELHQIYYQYTAAITPFLFIGMIYGIKNIRKLLAKVPLSYISGYIMLMAILGAYFYGPLPGAVESNLDMFTRPLTNRAYIETALATIDQKYSVAATNSLGSHLSQREHIYVLPNGIDRADVVVIMASDPNNQPSQQWYKDKIMALKKERKYQIITEKGDFVIFKKIVVK